MWLAIYTQPNIAYLVAVFSWCYKNSGPIHYNLVIPIIWYIAKTLKLGITFQVNITNKLVGYADSDWIRVKKGWRSTNRYAFLLSNRLISHQSKE